MSDTHQKKLNSCISFNGYVGHSSLLCVYRSMQICFEDLHFLINKVTSVFHASVLLLIMNFVITISS